MNIFISAFGLPCRRKAQVPSCFDDVRDARAPDMALAQMRQFGLQVCNGKVKTAQPRTAAELQMLRACNQTTTSTLLQAVRVELRMVQLGLS